MEWSIIPFIFYVFAKICYASNKRDYRLTMATADLQSFFFFFYCSSIDGEDTILLLYDTECYGLHRLFKLYELILSKTIGIAKIVRNIKKRASTMRSFE